MSFELVSLRNCYTVLLSQRESFVTVTIFELKIMMKFDVFEVPESK